MLEYFLQCSIKHNFKTGMSEIHKEQFFTFQNNIVLFSHKLAAYCLSMPKDKTKWQPVWLLVF